MNEEFNKEELGLINKLRSFRQEVFPSKASFEDMLSSLPNNFDKGVVTNYDKYRYTFSMWKYALVALVIVIIGGFALLKHGQVNPLNPATPGGQAEQVTQNQEVPSQPVTADNADSTLQQTDSAISQTSDQMDKDLNSLDQTNSQEDDLNNI